MMQWKAACALALLTGLVGLGCPLGPLSGGRLSGEVEPAPVDWLFVNEVDNCQVETRPSDPHSVNVWCAGVGSHPYLPSSMILGPKDPSEREWVRNVLDDPEVRLRVGRVVYELQALRLEPGEEYDAARSALESKYELDPAERDADREIWIFRLEAR